MNRKQRRSAKKQYPHPHQDVAVIRGLLANALACHQSGDLAQAQRGYRTILAFSPAHAGGLHLLGIAALQTDRRGKAISLIGAAIRTDASVAAYHSNLGISLNDERRYLEAAGAFRQAVVREPAYADAWSNLANTFNYLSEPDNGAKASQRALRVKSDFAAAWCNLGNALNGLKRWDEAVKSSRQALVLRPNNPEALSNLGVAYENLRRYDAAECEYRRSLKLRPQFAGVFANLSGALRMAGQLEAALTLCRGAIALDPELPEAFTVLAMTLMDLGAFHMALLRQEAFLSRLIGNRTLSALAADPGLGEKGQIAASHILICYWLLGRLDQGYEAARQFGCLAQVVGKGGRENAETYLRYVSALFALAQRLPSSYSNPVGAADLHVIGESHSLVPANAQFNWGEEGCVGRPVFMMGVKMFHLTRNSTNHRRDLLEKQFVRLPAGSRILMTVGEIDCRIDEGIWHAHKTKGIAIRELVEATVSRYLDWIEQCVAPLAPKSMTIQGIPAPAYPLDPLQSLDERSAFIDMIRTVNALLMSGAAARGWWFLDVYAATANDEGTSNHVWHLDSHHLTPAFYIDAAQSFIVPPALPDWPTSNRNGWPECGRN
jgi:tetratricopeptide (TPR) repeat protein